MQIREMVDEVASLAQERSWRVAIAESLTSGNLAASVGAGADASIWFAGAVVAYAQDVKEKVLGLTGGTDPCSAECAEQLARGSRELLGADVAVSTTGIGGPEPEDGHPPGTVYLGWATGSGSGSRVLRIPGDPAAVVRRTTREGVELLREVIRAG